MQSFKQISYVFAQNSSVQGIYFYLFIHLLIYLLTYLIMM